MGLATGAHAPQVKGRAVAARLASCGRGRPRDMPRRTQGECGWRSRRHGLRYSRDDDAGRELGRGQFPDFGNGVAHGQHQPINGRVENEADRFGERRTATGAIGGKPRLIQLDQIFGLAAHAIESVVDPLGRADIEADDDKADMGDGASCAIPGLALWRVSV